MFDSGKDHHLIVLSIFLVTSLIAGMVGCDGHNPPPSQNLEIRTWYDLDAIRDNLAGNHTLMNDLDSATAGYTELASPTANGGKGWLPIRTRLPDGHDGFTGTFDGQGHEVRDLFIDRPDESNVGLFSFVYGGWDGEGVIQDIGVVNVTVTGGEAAGSLAGSNYGAASNSYSSGNITGGSRVGGLFGHNTGNVTNSYSTGTVAGEWYVGGLVGENFGTVSNSHSVGSLIGQHFVGALVGANDDTVSNSYAIGNVTGDECVGGLMGENSGIVSNSYSTGSAIGRSFVGALAGANDGTVSDSYAIGNVTGEECVGGLVGDTGYGTVSNSYYDYDEVLINGRNIITVGALLDNDFEGWMASGKFLDVNERFSQENGYYSINDVNGFKQLLAFGQNATLKFRLTNDLDFSDEPNFYIPYLAGEFDGNGHRISNLTFNFDFVSHVGLFGYLATGGKVTDVGLENIDINGYSSVGGLVGGTQEGTVSHCYSAGTVTGNDAVGGLVGDSNFGILSDSYSAATVMGSSVVGGLIGGNDGSVSNSYSTGRVTGDSDVGGLAGSNSRDLSNSHSTGRVTGDEHVGGLVGKNWLGGIVGNSYYSGGMIGNDYVGGLVGYNYYGSVDSSYSSGTVTGSVCVGGLIGCSEGDMAEVSASYSTANVAGNEHVGGLVGWGLDGATMYLSYSTGSVAGIKWVGGLVGGLGSSDYLRGCSVWACYSTGSVTGSKNVGGLVGEKKNQATVGGFWDIETSGQSNSAGGTGKTSAEMKNIATFIEAGWNIIAVGLNETDPVYIWNIVDGVTYPFLSWQP